MQPEVISDLLQMDRDAYSGMFCGIYVYTLSYRCSAYYCLYDRHNATTDNAQWHWSSEQIAKNCPT